MNGLSPSLNHQIAARIAARLKPRDAFGWTKPGKPPRTTRVRSASVLYVQPDPEPLVKPGPYIGERECPACQLAGGPCAFHAAIFRNPKPFERLPVSYEGPGRMTGYVGPRPDVRRRAAKEASA